MIYLASPYSHRYAYIRERRFRAACIAAGWLMQQGEVVYSPIAHSHPIAEYCDMPKEWEFWRKQDMAMLAKASALYVLVISGTGLSRGVQAEYMEARRMGLEICFLKPEDVGLDSKGRPAL